MIEVTAIAKRFGKTEAVREVSFAVKPGQCLGLLGPNGAGKTSSLRMVSGLLRADRGDISIDSIDVTKHPITAQRKLGVLPDNYGLYQRLTAAENIHYMGQLHGIDKRTLASRLQQLARRWICTISSGVKLVAFPRVSE